VVPSKMIVNDIEAVTLNGVVIEDYVLTSTLVNYVPKSVLNNYVMKTPFQLLSNRVDDIELVTNRFTYEDGTTNLHLKYESTFSIDVGDYTPMTFDVDGSVTLTSGLTVKDSDGVDTLMTIDEDGLTVTKLNGVLVSDYALNSSLTTLAALLNNYALTSSLANYVTSSSLTTTLGSYALTSSLANYVTSSSLTSTLGSYALTSSLTTVSNRVTTLETKTTSLSYHASATTISNALRLPMGMSIDPTNSIVYYGTNVRIEKWWIAP